MNSTSLTKKTGSAITQCNLMKDEGSTSPPKLSPDGKCPGFTPRTFRGSCGIAATGKGHCRRHREDGNSRETLPGLTRDPEAPLP